jgi:hypothetical protein
MVFFLEMGAAIALPQVATRYATPLLMKDFAQPTAVVDMPLGNDDPWQIHRSCRVVNSCDDLLLRCDIGTGGCERMRFDPQLGALHRSDHGR